GRWGPGGPRSRSGNEERVLMNLSRKASGRTVALGLLGLCLVWSYWPTLLELNERWSHDPQYSHGYLVPLFSLFLLWRRREDLRAAPFRCSWWGVLLLLAAAALRLVGAYFFVPWFDTLSLVPALAALCVLVGGGR